MAVKNYSVENMTVNNLQVSNMAEMKCEVENKLPFQITASDVETIEQNDKQSPMNDK